MGNKSYRVFNVNVDDIRRKVFNNEWEFTAPEPNVNIKFPVSEMICMQELQNGNFVAYDRDTVNILKSILDPNCDDIAHPIIAKIKPGCLLEIPCFILDHDISEKHSGAINILLGIDTQWDNEQSSFATGNYLC